jgi:cytochrome c-type biogenesis protein CcmH/NrfG
MGIVKWQGKGDPAGAVAAWQELLKRNPNYPEKARIEELIAKAKKHVQG